MNRYDFIAAIQDIQCPPYGLILGQEAAGDGRTRHYLQVRAMLPDNTAPAGSPAVEQKGRKWWLSEHMTKSEVVSTCLKAILTFAEHEIREHFLYRGRAIYDPHWDVDMLWRLRSSPVALSERAPMPAKTDRAGAEADADADMLHQLVADGEISDCQHGWVIPHMLKAKCGGPSICNQCREDAKRLALYRSNLRGAQAMADPLMGALVGDPLNPPGMMQPDPPWGRP